MADLNEVMLMLGRMQGSLEKLSVDFAEEKRSAADSRANVHRRMDEQAHEMASVKADVMINAQIAAQTREEVKSLGGAITKHKEEIQPSVDDWKRMKQLGVGLAGLLALGGLSAGALLTWAGDTAAAAVRRWLGI